MRNIKLSDRRFLAALKRMRARIANGVELEGYNDTTTGAKNTEVSWGMCYQGPEFWPREDQLFPDREPINGCVSPLYMEDHQLCPFDQRTPDVPPEELFNGCFYTCRFFKGERPTREQALKMYDVAIDKHAGSSRRTSLRRSRRGGSHEPEQ